MGSAGLSKARLSDDRLNRALRSTRFYSCGPIGKQTPPTQTPSSPVSPGFRELKDRCWLGFPLRSGGWGGTCDSSRSAPVDLFRLLPGRSHRSVCGRVHCGAVVSSSSGVLCSTGRCPVRVHSDPAAFLGVSHRALGQGEADSKTRGETSGQVSWCRFRRGAM